MDSPTSLHMDGPTDKSPGPFFGPADSGLRTLDLSLALRTEDWKVRSKERETREECNSRNPRNSLSMRRPEAQ